MNPASPEDLPGPAQGRRGRSFAAQTAEAAVHVLFVSAALVAALLAGGDRPFDPAAAVPLLVLATTAGALFKLGDDLEDEAIHAAAGRLVTLAGVAGLAAACWINQELLWLVAGGALAVLLAGKVDRPAAVAGIVLFAAVGAAAAWATAAVPRADLCAIGAGSVLADELLAGWTRRRADRSARGSSGVPGWLLRSRFLVSAAVLAAYLVDLIGAAACLAALLFDLGYAAAGAALARFLAKNDRHSAPAATRRTRNSAGNAPKP